MCQQFGSDLLLEGVVVGSGEVLEFEVLLEFLEELLDGSALAVQFGVCLEPLPHGASFLPARPSVTLCKHIV